MGDSIPFQALLDLGDTLGADRKIAFSEAGLGLEIRDIMPRTREAIRGSRRRDIFLVFIGTHQSNTDPPEIWRAELRRLLDLVSPRVDCIRGFEIDDEDTGFYPLHDRQAATYNRITRQITGGYAKAEWYHNATWADLAGHDRAHHDPPANHPRPHPSGGPVSTHLLSIALDPVTPAADVGPTGAESRVVRPSPRATSSASSATGRSRGLDPAAG